MATKLRDLKIPTKLALAFGLVLALLATNTIVGVSRLAGAQADLEALNDSGVVSVLAIGGVESAFDSYRIDLLTAALASDDFQLQAVDAAARDARQLDEAWQAYLATGPKGTPAQLKAFEDALAGYRKAAEPFAQLALGDDVEAIAGALETSVRPTVGPVDDAVAALKDAERRDAAAYAAEGAATSRASFLVLVLAGLLALCVGAGCAVAISRSITGPLRKVLAVVSGLAEGRLDQRTGVERADEVGQLAAATDASLDNLAALVRQIGARAESVATSSDQLSSVSAQLTGGAEQSAAQARLVATTSEQISSSMTTIAAAGEEMTSAIGEIASSTATAAQTASDAVRTAEAAGATVDRLDTSSREIGDVVKLITSIAEQTNLLALNATIEAARAGELGKGFAVVAGEVKELARQTARATDQIVARVNTAQADAADARAAISEIREVIARIDALQATVASAVEEQSATTAEMVRSVTEASSGTREISATIADVADGAAQTTTSASSTTATAADLAATATQLRAAVAAFRL